MPRYTYFNPSPERAFLYGVPRHPRGRLLPRQFAAATAQVSTDFTALSLLPWIDPRAAAYGAVVDGVTDDTAALQAAVDAAHAAGGGLVFLVAGMWYISGTITLYDNVAVIGIRTATIILSPAGRTTPVFDVDSIDNIHVGGMRATKASGAVMAASAYFVRVRGACDNVTIETIVTGSTTLPASGERGDGFVSGVYVDGNSGDTPGYVTNLTISDVRCNNSPTSWNFHLAYVKSPVLDNVRGQGALLDGLKLYNHTFDVRITNFDFSDNGWGYTINPALYAGDGIDGLSGEDLAILDTGVCLRNYGNGITIKTGTLATFPAATWGYVRRLSLSNLHLSDQLVGAGLNLNLNDPNDLTEPMVNRVTMLNVFADGNATDGWYLSARNVTAFGGGCKGNGRYGIYQPVRGFDTELHGVVSLANATANLAISGKYIRTFGGTFYGVDPDTCAVPGDLASATPVSTYCILIAAGADEVYLDYPNVGYQSTVGVPISVGMTSGVCVIKRRGTGTPYATTLFGGPGSTWDRTDSGGLGVQHFTKGAGAPNTSTPWLRDQPVGALAQTVNTTQTSIAHGCGYAPTVVVIKTRTAGAIISQSAVPDATNVYLLSNITATVDIGCH
jgi:hypothetical protein